MPDPHFSDLIIPQNEQPSMSQLLSSLKRTTLTIHNRLTSIRADAAFVSRVAQAYAPRPLIANERCGSWYIPPEDKAAGAYFKSTDGHERAWKFSSRRLNLHLLEVIENNDGIIIVDSTRRGKRMPDALSTTLPIWCTVLNMALLPSHPSSPILHLPPFLPASNHAQITALLPQFLSSLKALKLDLPECLTKPLRPIWVTPESSLPEGEVDGAPIFDDFRPVICCTASRRVVGNEVDEGGYIQGAGDDTENWAHGLTPPVFWKHVDELTAAAEADLPGLILQFLSDHQAESSDSNSLKELTQYIAVCPLPLTGRSNDCHIALTSETTSKDSWIKSPTFMQVGLGKSKTASRNMRPALPEICDFASKFLTKTSETNAPSRIIIACESGKDLSVGVALALSCYLFDEEGTFRKPLPDTSYTKTLIKSKLGSIMTAHPEANPSRSTLQSVNSFLMDWRK